MPKLFPYMTKYRSQKVDGQYEPALGSLMLGLGKFRPPHFQLYLQDNVTDERPLFNELAMRMENFSGGQGYFGTENKLAPWIYGFRIQEATDCMEARRRDSESLIRKDSPKSVANSQTLLTNHGCMILNPNCGGDRGNNP